jgi:SAM-dependent methyltransferase
MTPPQFKDHFSERAAGYAVFRPRYPDALFAWLADLVPDHALAWDAGTGNGQAATGLARWFDRVHATDASEKQIANAEPDERVRYAVGPESASGLPDASCDLVTAAQALHWFDVPAFFREARRVLKPGGTIAIWTYGGPRLDEPALNARLQAYADHIAPYWPPERAMVDDAYSSVDFPFDELASRRFTMELQALRGELTGYLRTTSAQQRYIAEQGLDPVDWLEAQLAPAWPDDARHRITWPVTVRAGRTGDTFAA